MAYNGVRRMKNQTLDDVWLWSSCEQKEFAAHDPPLCRSKLHDDESRLIQGVSIITKMMTKSSRY